MLKSIRRESRAMSDITGLLKQAGADDRTALDQIFALLYDDVHRMARARLAGNQPQTLLATTGLAHEAFLFAARETVEVGLRVRHGVASGSGARIVAPNGGDGVTGQAAAGNSGATPAASASK